MDISREIFSGKRGDTLLMRKSRFTRLAILLLLAALLCPALCLSAYATGACEYYSMSMTVGADASERYVSWYMTADAFVTLEYAELPPDGEFPQLFYEVSPSPRYSNTNAAWYCNALLDYLEPDTEYAYRICINGETPDEFYTFKTAPQGSFEFLFVADPQIGATGNIEGDLVGWQQTLTRATTMFPNAKLLVSAGDQVESATNMEQYRAVLSPAELSSLAFAPTIGNHDSWHGTFSHHFTLPNTLVGGNRYGETAAGSDYWYRYNGGLFIHLNTNNADVEEHRVFMEYAIDENPDAAWKIVVLHHSLYSAGGHYNSEETLNLREELVPLLTELDVDVVLMGHDHVYVRTYMMNEFVPDDTVTLPTSVTDPTGILYLTGGTAAGQKWYTLPAGEAFPYAAVIKQEQAAIFTHVTVKNSSFAINVYRSDSGVLLDSFEIRRTGVVDDPGPTPTPTPDLTPTPDPTPTQPPADDSVVLWVAIPSATVALAAAGVGTALYLRRRRTK